MSWEFSTYEACTCREFRGKFWSADKLPLYYVNSKCWPVGSKEASHLLEIFLDKQWRLSCNIRNFSLHINFQFFQRIGTVK
jgi:hypothetical protein